MGTHDADAGRSAGTPFRRTAPMVGRNDPCPCGSGRKFKLCCGKTNNDDSQSIKPNGGCEPWHGERIDTGIVEAFAALEAAKAASKTGTAPNAVGDDATPAEQQSEQQPRLNGQEKRSDTSA
jgi:hypothetical protein